jgi:branched-chain amino acid transport system permease protein
VILFAVVLMGGIYTVFGAVIAGVLLWVLPALFTVWGIDTQLPTILFGVGVLQVLTTAPAGIAHQLPRDIAKLGRLLFGLVRKRTPTAGRAS